MKFNYRIAWFDANKNKREWCDMDDAAIAAFIARKKVADGMQSVVISVDAADSTTADQAVVDAEVVR